MRSIGYHFYDGGGEGIYKSSRRSTDEPLLINCAGRFVSRRDINTRSKGRADYYFLYIIDGALSVSFPDSERTMGTGSFLIFPPDTPYAYSGIGDKGVDYFWVHFTGSDAERLLASLRISCFPSSNPITEGGGAIARIQRFLDACATEDEFKSQELAVQFSRLLINIARSTSSKGENPLKKSISHINSSYNTELRIPMLARMENLSVSRYNALFKKLIGLSPTEYIIKTRMSFARELLESTDLSVKEISLLVGYSDPHFFSRLFKSYVGKSPRDYRNNL